LPILTTLTTFCQTLMSAVMQVPVYKYVRTRLVATAVHATMDIARWTQSAKVFNYQYRIIVHIFVSVISV